MYLFIVYSVSFRNCAMMNPRRVALVILMYRISNVYLTCIYRICIVFDSGLIAGLLGRIYF